MCVNVAASNIGAELTVYSCVQLELKKKKPTTKKQNLFSAAGVVILEFEIE